jgi:hypothetical protein
MWPVTSFGMNKAIDRDPLTYSYADAVNPLPDGSKKPTRFLFESNNEVGGYTQTLFSASKELKFPDIGLKVIPLEKLVAPEKYIVSEN